jgi:uncharacterized protein YdaU (DUF1376 family)
MDTREAFQQRIDEELDMVEEKLAKFKAQNSVLEDERSLKHARHVENLEQKLQQTKTKLYELQKAEEPVWEQLKDGVEDMWTTLQSTLEDTVTTFEEKKS